MSDEIEVFLTKVDAFAETLSTNEQAMLAYLMGDDASDADDVAGFIMEPWPANVRDVAPVKVESMLTNFGGFLSSGHTTGVRGEGLGAK